MHNTRNSILLMSANAPQALEIGIRLFTLAASKQYGSVSGWEPANTENTAFRRKLSGSTLQKAQMAEDFHGGITKVAEIWRILPIATRSLHGAIVRLTMVTRKALRSGLFLSERVLSG